MNGHAFALVCNRCYSWYRRCENLIYIWVEFKSRKGGLNYWAEVEFKFVCSNSTTSLPSQVLLMLMNCKPILSNSFMKCWLMNLVFSSNRPVSAFSSRPFTSIPNNSICLRNLENSIVDFSTLFLMFWLPSYLFQLLNLSNNNDQLQFDWA